MKHQISTSVIIHSSKENVWQALTNFSHYPSWNPFISSIEGKLEKGQQLNVTIGTMKFKPTIKELLSERELTWLGRLFIPGIFDGRHSFQLRENPDGTTHFIQQEDFSGILVPFMRKKLNTEIVNGFNQMNQQLKELVENNFNPAAK